MTLADVRRALDQIDAALPKLAAGAAELDRRARIPSKRDGYPTRASGAQAPNIVTASTVAQHTATARPTNDTWVWDCSCGAQGYAHRQLPLKDVLASAAEWCNSTSSVDYSDPTAEAAAALVDGHQRPDDVSLRHSRYEREIHRAARALAIALAQLKEPTDYDEGHRWCWSCARVKHDDGTPHLNPPWSRIKGKTDVNGRLPEPRDLCRVCYEHIFATGVMPSIAFCTEYLTRGRAPRKTA